MTKDPAEVTMLVTGEHMLNMTDDPRPYFEPAMELLRGADIVVGHLETPHTDRPAPAWENMTPNPPPDKMAPFVDANYSVFTLAGNPTYSYGPAGIEDTIGWMSDHGIAHVGAGMDLAEALRPAVLERNGTRVGFLSYDTVGNKENGASMTKAGAAYVDVITHYPPQRLTASAPAIVTWPEPWSMKAMTQNVERTRALCDVLVIGFHMGIGGREIELAEYQHVLAEAAIDAGADVVLGTHPHMLKGVDFYQGKPIFYSLGNFVAVYPLDGSPQAHFRSRPPWPGTRWKSRVRTRPGGQVGGPYDKSATKNNGAILKFEITGGAIERISCHPFLLDERGAPVPVGKSADGQQVLDYFQKVTDAAGLRGSFEWDDDEIVIAPKA